MTKDTSETLDKVAKRIDEYLLKYGRDQSTGKFKYPKSERLFQSDEMQEDGLEMIGDLLDILNDEG